MKQSTSFHVAIVMDGNGRRAPRGRGGRAPSRAHRARLRHHRALALRLLVRQLDPAGRRGLDLDAPVRAPSADRDGRARGAGRQAHRHRAAGPAASLAHHRDRCRRAGTGGRDTPRAADRRGLLRSRRDSFRRAAARRRSPHPHRRRAAVVRFPAVGVRLRRAVVHRTDVAGLRGATIGRRHPRVPLTRPPVRRLAHAGGRMIVLSALAPRTRLGLEIVAAGVVGGIVGDSLLRAMPWGFNVALGTTALVGAGAWLVRRHRITPGPDTAWLAITALLLGLAFLRRDAATLAAFDAIALIGALALAAASLQGELITTWYPFDLIRGIITATASSIFGGFVLLLSDIQWRELPQDDRLRNVRRVLWGVALATPLLLVFAALFASADQVFSNVLTNAFAFDAGTVISHMFFIGFWAFLVAGYLRWSFLGRPLFGLTPALKPVQSIVPLATALGLLNALFLLFVVVQLRYFFGGAALVEETSGLTYAEYARRGFFEL